MPRCLEFWCVAQLIFKQLHLDVSETQKSKRSPQHSRRLTHSCSQASFANHPVSVALKQYGAALFSQPQSDMSPYYLLRSFSSFFSKVDSLRRSCLSFKFSAMWEQYFLWSCLNLLYTGNNSMSSRADSRMKGLVQERPSLLLSEHLFNSGIYRLFL